MAELHPGIHQRHAEIGEDVADHEKQRGDDQNPHDHRVIPVNDRFISQQSHPIDVKNFFMYSFLIVKYSYIKTLLKEYM